MIPKECKRIAEVDFPIAVVSQHSAREKKVFGHHPQMLNQWARRPLAACRAMLLALLLPDPCDPCCPGEFKARARELLQQTANVGSTDIDLRKAIWIPLIMMQYHTPMFRISFWFGLNGLYQIIHYLLIPSIWIISFPPNVRR